MTDHPLRFPLASKEDVDRSIVHAIWAAWSSVIGWRRHRADWHSKDGV
jgi:hypothetical protein